MTQFLLDAPKGSTPAGRIKYYPDGETGSSLDLAPWLLAQVGSVELRADLGSDSYGAFFVGSLRLHLDNRAGVFNDGAGVFDYGRRGVVLRVIEDDGQLSFLGTLRRARDDLQRRTVELEFYPTLTRAVIEASEFVGELENCGAGVAVQRIIDRLPQPERHTHWLDGSTVCVNIQGDDNFSALSGILAATGSILIADGSARIIPLTLQEQLDAGIALRRHVIDTVNTSFELTGYEDGDEFIINYVRGTAAVPEGEAVNLVVNDALVSAARRGLAVFHGRRVHELDIDALGSGQETQLRTLAEALVSDRRQPRQRLKIRMGFEDIGTVSLMDLVELEIPVAHDSLFRARGTYQVWRRRMDYAARKVELEIVAVPDGVDHSVVGETVRVLATETLASIITSAGAAIRLN